LKFEVEVTVPEGCTILRVCHPVAKRRDLQRQSKTAGKKGNADYYDDHDLL